VEDEVAGSNHCPVAGGWYSSIGVVIEAQVQFRRAIEIDPNFGRSYAALSFAQLQVFNQGLSQNLVTSLHDAFDTATKANAVDDRDPLHTADVKKASELRPLSGAKRTWRSPR
jgi:hypothetical protein